MHSGILEDNPIILYNPRMPFPESIRRKEVAKAKACAGCKEPFPPGAYIEAHSATSLHLVLDKKSKERRYIVTDPPRGHEILRGRTLNAKIFSFGQTKDNDAFCLCPVCHDEIKRIALNELGSRNPEFKKYTLPPALSEEVTIFFVKRGRPMVYDQVNYDTEIKLL